jgi:branched-chain amino acid transport system substrate-binding protein
MILVSTVIATYGTDRQAIRNGLTAIKDVPSVIFGTITFGADRRVARPNTVKLVVKDGAFVLWDGKKPDASR